MLESLVRKEVLSIQADPRSPERGQYGFLQDLLRGSPTRRCPGASAARHLAAAEYLRRTFPDDEEVAEVIASHYLDAYRAAPDADDAAGCVRGRGAAPRRAAGSGAGRAGRRGALLPPGGRADGRCSNRPGCCEAGEMALRSAAQEARRLVERASALYEGGRGGSAARVTWRLPERPGPRPSGEAIGRIERAWP